jgi:sarcosine oxidase subunit beta
MNVSSLGTLLRNDLSNRERWLRQWWSPEPKASYTVVSIDGGDGLTIAYSFAKELGIRTVAIFEKMLAWRRQHRPHHDILPLQ